MFSGGAVLFLWRYVGDGGCGEGLFFRIWKASRGSASILSISAYGMECFFSKSSRMGRSHKMTPGDCAAKQAFKKNRFLSPRLLTSDPHFYKNTLTTRS